MELEGLRVGYSHEEHSNVTWWPQKCAQVEFISLAQCRKAGQLLKDQGED